MRTVETPAGTTRSRMKPLLLRSRPAIIAMLLTGWAASAPAAPKPQLQDVVLIPQTAVAVDHLKLIGKQTWTPLNRRMLLVRIAQRPHVLVFESNCPRLTESGAIISTRTPEMTLYPRTDFVYISRRGTNLYGRTNSALDVPTDPIGIRSADLGVPCQIDRMYKILDEDIPVLRKQLEEVTDKKAD